MFKSKATWWKGTRGEWYVVVQIALFALLVFGPRTWSVLPAWKSPYLQIGSIAGGVSMAVGIFFVMAGIVNLGANITAVPRPKDMATLVETGLYRLVRHPIYSGVILAAFGWALFIHGWLTIGYAMILYVYFDFKASYEEQCLKEIFPDYASYQRRVPKLIPFLY